MHIFKERISEFLPKAPRATRQPTGERNIPNHRHGFEKLSFAVLVFLGHNLIGGQVRRKPIDVPEGVLGGRQFHNRRGQTGFQKFAVACDLLRRSVLS